MPRPPGFAASVRGMPGAVYSPFAERARAAGREVAPLHVGDTWLEPCVGARAEDQRSAERSGLHRYSDTRGVAALVDALVEKLRARNGIAAERESVLVCAGATAGLGCLAGALLEPGDEVLVLAPFWPLIRGIVQMWGGRAVEVPFYDRVRSAEEARARVQAALTPRTVALYVSSPSNPTGVVLAKSWIEALVDVACRADLWLWSDECYEDYVYHGEHVSLAPLAPERTVSSFSFSKAYGLAGTRVGYLAGPPALIDEARKLGTHTFYCAPTPGQYGALAALEQGDGWLAAARSQYAAVGRQAAELLGVPAPAGSQFLFVDVAQRLGTRGLAGFLEDCYEDGVLVAPGAAAGAAYGSWIRLCYTAAPPETVLRAVRALAKRVRGGAPPPAAS
jgi:aspartate/methionine/tyrosine aminotransferase